MSQLKDSTNKLFDSVQIWLNKSHQETLLNAPSTYFVPAPGDWSGNPIELEEISKAFKRTDLHDAFRAVITEATAAGDINAAGSSGLLASIILQGDTVAAAERAYRSRHISFCRRQIHASARARGMGSNGGVWLQSMRRFMEHIERLGQDE